MKLLDIKQTSQGDPKKLVAIFDNRKIKFGSKGSKTYASGATEKVKNAYIARHKINEDWNSINAGSLSKYVLWSSKSLSQGIKNFKNKFGV